MQFEHMEVRLDRANRSQVLGPFSFGLNAIVGPRGSGKTRLLQWLRQLISENRDPITASQDRYQDISGAVDLRSHGYHLRVERSAAGKRSIHADPRSQSASQLSARQLSERQQHAFDLLSWASQSGNEVAALDEVAMRLGLDMSPNASSKALRDQLVAREHELIASLDSASPDAGTREELLNRRRDIEFRLNQIHQRLSSSISLACDSQFRLDRFTAVEADLRGALAEIEQCDREMAAAKADLRLCEIGSPQVQVDQSYREQLQSLEDRLNRWRQTLRDIKQHRESIEHEATDASLDEQAGTHLSGTLYPDSRGAIRSLEAQLHNARKQLDQLVYQYASGNQASVASQAMQTGYASMHHPAVNTYSTVSGAALGSPVNGHPPLHGFQVQRDSHGRAHIELDARPSNYLTPDLLPEMLRSMQKDLQEVCHHLSRCEAQSAAQTLRQQVQQLRRCEAELLQSVERLIEERGVLLRKIADKYHLTSDQVTLTFGDWCQCSDHEHLYDWLLKDEATHRNVRSTDGVQRTKLTDTLARLQAQRKEASLRAEECRRQLREIERGTPTHTPSAPDPALRQEESELLRELDGNQRLIHDLECRDRWRAELDEVRRQLAQLPQTPANHEYRESVDRHLLGLGKSLYHPLRNGGHHSSTNPWDRAVNGSLHDPIRSESRIELPREMIAIAQRLAIAQLLSSRGDSVPLFLDQTLDSLSAETQVSVIDYLVHCAQHQQIFILSDNRHVADCVRARRGQVFSISLPSASAVPEEDINRVLTSFANEHEADKWYRPNSQPTQRPRVRQYYLSQYSRIEELPVMPPSVAERCRSLGIDSVGDLLDADAVKLASQLRLARIGDATIRNWQSIAILLCSVRGLRPFDARLLVGAGIGDATQLSEIQPSQLLERVERFLTTDAGQRILRSGNSYELSRITSWIASAKNGAGRPEKTSRPSQRRHVFDVVDGAHSHRNSPHSQFGEKPTARKARKETANDRQEAARRPKNRRAMQLSANVAQRYYLELSSAVQDSPSVGPKTAQRLNAQSIYTVEQLLEANPETVARRLGHRRISADTVRQWQDQARIVCRIPNMRGHDAQMLVACQITSPETLTHMSPESVLRQVLTFAQSAEGQRVLRGNKEPDLAEVRDWIAWASQSRSLKAA